jgi:hypothetical protein
MPRPLARGIAIKGLHLASGGKQAQAKAGVIGLIALAIAAVLILTPSQVVFELIPRLNLPALYGVAISFIVFIVAALVLLAQVSQGEGD